MSLVLDGRAGRAPLRRREWRREWRVSEGRL